MKITYDRQADAIYIQLVDGQHYHCKVVTEDCVLDFMGEELAGIELLGARRLLAKPDQPSVEVEL